MNRHAAPIVALLVFLTGCEAFGPSQPLTIVHPLGGVVIFYNGVQTTCSSLTKIVRDDNYIVKVRCDQPDGFMEFRGRHIAGLKIFTR